MGNGDDLGVLERDAAAALRRCLDAAGFGPEHAEDGRADPSAEDGPSAHGAESGPDVLDRLFRLGATVARSEADAALGADLREVLVAAGFVTPGDEVTSPIRITRFLGHLFVHDPSGAEHRRPDHVTGINPTTRTLASLTLSTSCARTLDVGTGCGVQAILAAAWSDHVVATDVVPRALALTRTNLALNGIDNVECRQGSFFESVAGETFDRVVCNPPFVVSPDDDFAFRDGGTSGPVFEHVVRTVPEHLTAGGTGHLLGSWGLRADEEWSAPVESWVEGSACDAWLLRAVAADPRRYARTWIVPRAATDPTGHVVTLRRWLAYYAREGIDSLVTGALVLRRRADQSSPWFRADVLSDAPSGDASRQIERVTAAADAPPDPDRLLDATVVPVDGHRLEQTLSFEDGTYQVADASLHLDHGVGIAPTVSMPTVHVLFLLDGRTTLGSAISAVADQLGAAAEVVTSTVVPEIQRLHRLGYADVEAVSQSG